MNTIFINALLAVAWTAVTGSFTLLNFVFGFVLGGIVLVLIREQVGALSHFRRAFRATVLAFTFVWELVKSSVNVAILVLSPGRTLSPAIIAFPLSLTSDAGITLLANMLTLTPGTLSMDVSDDRQTLFVHAMDAPDTEAVIADIKNTFEAQIMRLFE